MNQQKLYEFMHYPGINSYALAGYHHQHGESNSNFKPIYPAKDSHSEILPYNQRDHAYNEDQYDMSHLKTWNESRPDGYYNTSAFMASDAPIYPSKDSHSEILPYD